MSVVRIKDVSDGDRTHRPKSHDYYLVDPILYREKLAKLWMDYRKESKPGVRYLLDRLPEGYAVYEKKRSNAGGSHSADRWLFGNPNHKTFDSPNRFFPHFLYLMENDWSNIGCPCTVCKPWSGGDMATTSPSQPKAALPSPKLKGRPKLHVKEALDDEGTPDAYRMLINLLQRKGELDVRIQEPFSMDWRAERTLLPDMFENISKKPAWVPRIGEIVLFVRKLSDGEEICFDDTENEFKIWNTTRKEYTGHPVWEAGMVSQPATVDIPVEDLVEESPKNRGINYTGFRVEPLPDPDSEDKSLSKQYKYVPMHQIRPFTFWQEFLRGVPEDKWHPTIRHAFKSARTFSLLEKYQFKGIWPCAEIYCKGIYLGPELLLVGDVVRITPRTAGAAVTDFLRIRSIKLKFIHLDKASDNDYDDGHPYNTTVHVSGDAWSLDPARAAGALYDGYTNHDGTSLPPVLSGYDELYPIHGPTQELMLPFHRVFGRVYEDDAMLMWFPPSQKLGAQAESMKDDTVASNDIDETYPDPSHGLDGSLHARDYAYNHDKRIYKMAGKSWFWADTRAEALDLETVNGSEVRNADKERKPKYWRKWCKTLVEMEEKAERAAEAVRRGLREPRLNGNDKGKEPTRQEVGSLKRRREELDGEEDEEEASEIEVAMDDLPLTNEMMEIDEYSDVEGFEVVSPPGNHPVIVID